MPPRLPPKSRTFFQLLALLALFAAQAHSASLQPTLTSITVDGAFDDWSQVFTNPLQLSRDGNGSVTGSGCYPTNPDRDCGTLSGTGRDILEFAWTYDATNIYTYLKRERSTAAVMHYTFIMDLDEDGIAETSDRVLDVTWNSGANLITSVELFSYVPAATGGDPMACPTAALCPAPKAVDFVDGYSVPGSAGPRLWSVTNVPGGSLSGGDRFEVYIPWAQLGLAPGSPVIWHVASSTNGNFSSAIDNVGGPDGKIGTFGVYGVSVTPDYEGSAASPGTRGYCHTITNIGQFRDSYDLMASSTIGLPVAFYSDCSGTTLVALDANGDGDFLDVGDTAASGVNDTNANGLPDTEPLTGQTSTTRLIQLQIPSGFTGTQDLLTVTARSIARPTRVSATARDLTRIGAVTVGPEQQKSGTAGAQVLFGPFTVQNNQSVSDTFDFAVTSSAAYSLSIYANVAGAPGALLGTDSDGDGAWDAAVPNSGSIASGGTFVVWLRASIPAGAPLGALSEVTLRASSQTAPSATAASANGLTVRGPLTMTPSYVAPETSFVGNTATSVYLPHRIINSQSASDNVTLSIGTAPAAGYTMRWFTDPDCDGAPGDGAVVAGPLTIAAFGGTACFVTEIKIPLTGAGTQSVQTTVATGSLAGATAQVNDDVTVGNLQTFSDSNFALASRSFGPCSTIYVRANSLTGSTTTTYQLRFIDPVAGIVSTVNMATNPSGVGTGSYTLNSSSRSGNWTVQLRQGATVLNTINNVLVEQSGAVQLTVPPSGAVGQPLALSTSVSNTATRASYAPSTVLFEVKDPSLALFVQDTGPVATVAPGASDVTAVGFPALNYPAYGNYTVVATWKSACGGTIGSTTATFPVAPPAPTLVSPADGAAVATTTPSLTGTSVSGGTVTLTLDGVTLAPISGGSFSFTTGALAQGTHSWSGIQTVNGVSSAPSATRTFTVDTVAPSSSISAPTEGQVFNTAPVTINGSASDATSGVARAEVSVNGGSWLLATGTTSWSFAFTPSSDGTFGVRSRAVDNAGNTSAPSATVTFTFDSTAPQTTLLSTPAAVTASTSATFTFDSSETPSTFQCSLDGASFTACTSGQSYSNLSGGSHTFQVRATDSAGNTDSSPAAFTWTVDDLAPTVSFSATPVAVSNSATAGFTFAASEPATLACSLDGAAFTTCTSPRTLSGLAEGSHTFSVRATDSVGNIGPTAGITWTVDTQPPSSTITSPADGARFRTGPITVTVTAADSTSGVALVQVSVNGGAFQNATGSGPYSFSFTPGADGSYTIESRATDVATNVEVPTSLVTIVWDTLAPQTTITASPAASTSNTDAAFSFTSSEAGSTFECRLDAAVFATCTSPRTFTGLAEGSHTFQVRATDAAGNLDLTPASFTWTIDTSAPTVSFTATPPALAASSTAEFAFTASEPGTLECSLDGAAFAACTSPVTLTSLSQGAHGFSVRATDLAANLGPTATFNWTVDTVAPTVTFTATPAPVTVATSATFDFTASEASSTFSCSLDGAPSAPCTAPTTHSGLSEGPHSYAVFATDPAGNPGVATTFSWRVDTTAPETSFTSTPAANDSSSNATFDFASNEAAVTYECQLDGAAGFTACSDPETFSMLADGTHTLLVRAVDAAGLMDQTPASFSWNIDTSLPDTTIVAGPPSPTNQTTASFTFSSTAPGATYECKLDGASTFSACLETDAFPNLTEGVHTLAVRSLNAALVADPSPATFTWTVDLTLPAAPVVDPISPTLSSPPITGTGEPGGTVTIVIDNVVVGTAPVAPDGTFTFTPPTPLPDGPHTVVISVTDPAGNTGPGTTVNVITDTLPPTVSITSNPATLVNSASADFGFTSTEAGTFQCRVDAAVFAPCTSVKNFSSLSDGSHTFQVKARDTAGNESPTVSYTWTIDTVRPTVTITVAPASLTKLNAATFEFTSTESGTFECRVDLAAFAPCSSPQSYSALSDGSHTFEVRATDAATNTSLPASHTWTVDTQAPTVTFTSGPAAQTKLTTATLVFSSEAQATLECRLDAAPFAACTSPRSFSGLGDGAHSFAVRATDVAGNQGPVATYSWFVDRTAPVTTFTSTPSSPLASTSASYGFSSNESGSTFECSLDAATFAACTSTTLLTGLGQGSHTFEVRATDPAGNLGASISHTFTVDTVPPGAPTLDPIAANDSTPTISGTAEAGSTVTIVIDNVVVGTAVAGPDGVYTFTPTTPLSDGVHTVSVSATDLAGNPGPSTTVSVTTDTVSPVVTITTAPPTLTNSASAAFAYTSSEAGSFRCRLDGAVFQTCPSSITYSSLGEGAHQFQVIAVDAAGNSSLPATHSFTVDTLPPTVSFTSGPAANSPSPAASFGFTSTEPSTFTCSLDGEPFVACTSPDARTGLSDGDHTMSVIGTDAAGNPSAPATYTFRVDTRPPVVSITSAPPAQSKLDTATFVFSSDEPGTLECSLDGAAFAPCTSPRTVSGLSDGPNTFSVRATDLAGNPSAVVTHSWTVDTIPPLAPVVDPVTPTDATPTLTGTAEPGATVTIVIDGAVVGTAPADASGNFTFTLTTPLADGSHTLEFTATDPAGNTSGVTTVSVITDTQDPVATITSKPAPLTNSAAASFDFSASEPSTFLCSLDGAAFTGCTGPLAYTSLVDGDHTFQVKAVDVGGNVSAPASWTWKVDTVAPVAPTLGPISRTDSTPTLSGTAEPGSTVTLNIDGTIVSVTADSAGNYSYTPVAALSEGPHTVTVTATDPAGNSSPATPGTFNTDTVAPNVTFTSTPPAQSNDSTPSFSFSASETPVSYFCSVDGGAFVSCTSPHTLSTLSDGTHVVEVRAVDAAGNTGSVTTYTWSIDTAAPDTAFVSTPPSLDSAATAPFTFSATEAGSTFECRLDGGTFQSCSNPASFTMLAEGSHTLEVRATDPAGNVDATPASYSWSIDTTLPDTTIIAAPAAQTNAVTASFTFGSTAADATFECRLDGAASFSPCPSTTAFTDLSVGSHTLAVRAKNAAGSVDPSPATHAWSIDLTAPDTTITSGPDPVRLTGDGTFTFTATESDATFECAMDGEAFSPCTTPLEFEGLPEGSHQFQVRAKDAFGNVDPTPAEWSWIVNADPLYGLNVAVAGGGCGCSSDGGGFGLFALASAAVALSRRRRAAQRS